MQAIILAAGMGKRLGSYTKDNTKCMVSVNGVKLIDRLIPQLASLSLKKIIIVVGYQRENLKKYLQGKYDDLVRIEFIDNPVYDKTNNIYSLSLAKDQLQEDDTILVESDLIFEDSLFKMAVDSPYPNLALVAKYESWMDGTMIQKDEDDNIVSFIPKKAFKYSDIDSYYKTVNIYKFSKEFSKNIYVPFLEAYCKALGNNEYYEQVLRVITLLDHADLKAVSIENRRWYEIDDCQDLDIAETIFSDDSLRLDKMMSRYGGYWRFPGLLDFCYLVNPYFPTKKMKDELKANFDILLTQYPSGMKVNSLLAAKFFGIDTDYTVVGNGAAELIKSIMEYVTGKIGVVYPTFEEYPNRKKSEVVPFMVRNDNFSYSVSELISFYKDKDIQILLLVNPDNPSGHFVNKEDVISLVQWCKRKDVRLIVDESFVDFTDNYQRNSLLEDEILEQFENLVVIKSISKSYGVPGLRLGIMASSDKELISWVKKDVAIWNINSFAEFYLQIYGKYANSYKKACDRFLIERNRFKNKLERISFLRVLPTQANFFLCEVIDKFSSTELAEMLLNKYNVLVKDCTSKNGLMQKNYIRIAIRNEADNQRILEILQNIDGQRGTETQDGCKEQGKE